jgi:hypothetical protein
MSAPLFTLEINLQHTALWQHLNALRYYQSNTYHHYRAILLRIHQHYTARVLSAEDYLGLIELLYDTDQIVGNYPINGHASASHRQLPRDWQ